MKLNGKWSTILANNGIGDWPLQGEGHKVQKYCDKHGYVISSVLYDGPSFNESIIIFIDHQGVQLVL